MIANLENDAYIKALVDEAYATIFTGSTTNTVAQKKVARIFEAEGCHIGASAKHDTWADKNYSYMMTLVLHKFTPYILPIMIEM